MGLKTQLEEQRIGREALMAKSANEGKEAGRVEGAVALDARQRQQEAQQLAVEQAMLQKDAEIRQGYQQGVRQERADAAMQGVVPVGAIEDSLIEAELNGEDRGIQQGAQAVEQELADAEIEAQDNAQTASIIARQLDNMVAGGSPAEEINNFMAQVQQNEPEGVLIEMQNIQEQRKMDQQMGGGIQPNPTGSGTYSTPNSAYTDGVNQIVAEAMQIGQQQPQQQEQIQEPVNPNMIPR